jgi:hypothetical protein
MKINQKEYKSPKDSLGNIAKLKEKRMKIMDTNFAI